MLNGQTHASAGLSSWRKSPLTLTACEVRRVLNEVITQDIAKPPFGFEVRPLFTLGDWVITVPSHFFLSDFPSNYWVFTCL